MTSEQSFHVSEDDLNFLSSHIIDTALLEAFEVAKQKGRIESRSTTKLFALSLSSAEQDELEDSLVSLFSNEGVDASGEPNAMGYYVEGLIDSFASV